MLMGRTHFGRNLRYIVKVILGKRSKIEIFYDLVTKLSKSHRTLQLREIRMNNRGELFIIMENGLSIFFAGSEGEIEYGDGQNLIFKGINKNEVYPELLTQYLFTEIKSFVDIGANNGYYYSLQAAKFGINEIHAFEPNPKILTHLYKNIHENNFQEVIKVYEIALSNLRLTNLSLAANRGANSRIVQKKRMRDKILKVSTRKFDDLDLTLTNPTLIKIDVEGYELDVLKGANKFVEQTRPYVILEINKALLKEYGTNIKDIENYFLFKNYVLQNILNSNDYFACPKENQVLLLGASKFLAVNKQIRGN